MGVKRNEIELNIKDGAWEGLLWAGRALYLADFGLQSFPFPATEGWGWGGGFAS